MNLSPYFLRRLTRNTSRDDGVVRVDNERNVVEGRTNKKITLTKKRKHVRIGDEINRNLNDKSIKINQNCQVNNDDSSWKPDNWEVMLENIMDMRKSNDAPVDSMGCDQMTDNKYTTKEQRYHTLISLMMSSQTRDEVNHAAMCRLKEHGLSVDNILKMDDDTLGQLIYPVGFWKNKVKYIKGTTRILKSEYDGDIPNSVENLCKLPGVGPKMAYLAMTVAWKKVVGIGVDTHVHRISNRLKWVRKPTKTPEATRLELENWLPRHLWEKVNHLMVGFGQQICRPINPRCKDCLNKDVCPSSKIRAARGK
ncbi:NTHL1 (predicted) [Pycnogonum litorale]